MPREMKIGAGIWAALIAMSLMHPFGAIFAAAWVAGGIYFCVNSTSTGFWGDLTFIATWPLHWWMER